MVHRSRLRRTRRAPAAGACFALLVAACAAPPPAVDSHRIGRPAGHGPRVLAVIAHPDDEIAFAAAVYLNSVALGGTCDLLVITNGEGGYKYSTLAEPIYGLELTDPDVGRRHLPDIRRAELIEGCALLGFHELVMLRETDHRYTLDAGEVLAADAAVWDLARVAAVLDERLQAGHYDFVLTHLPVPATHGHHKAATILALDAVGRLPAGRRPVVLGSGRRPRAATEDRPEVPRFAQLEGHPITRVDPTALFAVDRTAKFGHRHQLDYRIVANWAIAAHKSQGTMQTFVNGRGEEVYYLFELSGTGARERAEGWFAALAAAQQRAAAVHAHTVEPEAGS